MDSQLDPQYRWTWHPGSVQRDGGGSQPTREAGPDDPPPVKHPLGFAPPAPKEEQEPQLWEGD